MGVVGKIKLRGDWKAFGPVEVKVSWRPSRSVASLDSERKLQQKPTEEKESIVLLPIGRRGQTTFYKRLTFFRALSIKIRLSFSKPLHKQQPHMMTKRKKKCRGVGENA